MSRVHVVTGDMSTFGHRRRVINFNSNLAINLCRSSFIIIIDAHIFVVTVITSKWFPSSLVYLRVFKSGKAFGSETLGSRKILGSSMLKEIHWSGEILASQRLGEFHDVTLVKVTLGIVMTHIMTVMVGTSNGHFAFMLDSKLMLGILIEHF